MPIRSNSLADSFPITIYRGAACSEVFQLADSDSTPMDVSDFTFTLILTDVFADTYRLVTGASPTANGSQITITDGPNGRFSFVIADEDTLDANLGSGRWALQLDEGDGFPYILYKDTVSVQDL